MSAVSKATIRRKVREVLNMRPGFGKTEKMLHEGVNELVGGGVNLTELREAIEWNHAEAFVRREDDKESEETLWFITAEGIAKQNI